MLAFTLILLQPLLSSQAGIIWGSLQPIQSENLAAFQRRLPVAATQGNEMEGFIPNDKAWLLSQAEANGTSWCDQLLTTQALIFGLELANTDGNFRLATNQHHRLHIVSLSENGTRRCSGGDFYETDLSGANWKSRPPIKDLGDGSYLVDLWVDSRMAGLYTFKVILLFSNLHGLDVAPDSWAQFSEVLQVQIEFTHPSIDSPAYSGMVSPLDLQLCSQEDFKAQAWQGRWIRLKRNESCVPDEDGRFKCLEPDEQCEGPWCAGPLGSLESNGWVYSAHCAFRLFTRQEAWSCLNGRSLFFWGDSNHQHTIQNLLTFVMDIPFLGQVERIFQANFSNPLNLSEWLKITSIYNGHHDPMSAFLGLLSLQDAEYRARIQSHFLPSNEAVLPDTVILNSGLHDATAWPDLSSFAEGVRYASMFWEDIWRNSSPEKPRRPRLLFRTTIAPAGGTARAKAINPHKMEAFNIILGEELTSTFDQDTFKIVDAYDMTFPWHYDNKYSDGTHYGQQPNSFDLHEYFVDIMLAHVLLNAICPT